MTDRLGGLKPPAQKSEAALLSTRAHLLAARHPAGHWVGELSSSALSTATASFTLSLAGRRPDLVSAGQRWLVATQNADGGWGDTTASFSNLPTSALCWAALPRAEFPGEAARVEAYIARQAGSLDPAALSGELARRYGKDRTFSVPILTMLALAGRLGPDPWRHVPQLPAQLAALPFRFFQVVKLPVVSYALPALIAIGLVRHTLRPGLNPMRPLRALLTPRLLRVLRAIQPTTGGYLEATPLTSFVTMSLLGAELDSPVVAEGLRFLADQARPDGSWPIDSNLATWGTTLATRALGGAFDSADAVRAWLLNQQYRRVHPYTQSPPGGWAWTDLPGGVPDGDDTPGALLALHALGPDLVPLDAIEAGVNWLLNLQNRDGGVPTFCRGWGALPFDRSSNDLTAHTLLAWHAWRPRLSAETQARIDRQTRRAVTYLMRTQHQSGETAGAWEPLWFGNEHSSETPNLTYGTSRVCKLLECAADWPADFTSALRRGQDYLLRSQHESGGWGGRAGTPPGAEETALALDGLLSSPRPADRAATERGVAWLVGATDGGTRFEPAPIGFYFANLWYSEKLYPAIFATQALRRWG